MFKPSTLSLAFSLWLLLGVPVARCSSFGEKICQGEGYSCFKVARNTSWESLFANEHDRDLIKRLNRMNIRLREGMTIAVPDSFKNLAERINPFSVRMDTGASKQIIVNKSLLAWAAYDAGGNLVRWGPLSAARGYCPDVGRACKTPAGSFSVYVKKGAECKSSIFPIGKGGAPMPYCMFFYSGYALHGSYDVPGYNASHGCVRLFIEDARWLNENFAETPANENNFSGTSVLILAPAISDENLHQN